MQSDLGATLAQLRVSGVGDLYQGALARRFATAASAIAGGGVTLADLRAALPKTVAPIVTVAVRKRPGGLPAATGRWRPGRRRGVPGLADHAWRTTPPRPKPAPLAVADTLACRRSGRRCAAGDQGCQPPAPCSSLPASTSFATLDRDGNAVVCVADHGQFVRHRPHRTRHRHRHGRVASQRAGSRCLAAAIAWNPSLRAFRAAIGGSGQEGAPHGGGSSA